MTNFVSCICVIPFSVSVALVDYLIHVHTLYPVTNSPSLNLVYTLILNACNFIIALSPARGTRTDRRSPYDPEHGPFPNFIIYIQDMRARCIFGSHPRDLSCRIALRLLVIFLDGWRS